MSTKNCLQRLIAFWWPNSKLCDKKTYFELAALIRWSSSNKNVLIYRIKLNLKCVGILSSTVCWTSFGLTGADLHPPLCLIICCKKWLFYPDEIGRLELSAMPEGNKVIFFKPVQQIQIANTNTFWEINNKTHYLGWSEQSGVEVSNEWSEIRWMASWINRGHDTVGWRSCARQNAWHSQASPSGQDNSGCDLWWWHLLGSPKWCDPGKHQGPHSNRSCRVSTMVRFSCFWLPNCKLWPSCEHAGVYI